MGGWIYGYVDTSAPGYRALKLDAVAVTVASGYYRGDDYITALSSALGASGWGAADNGDGTVTLSGVTPRAIAWTDRLGWLVGADAEAGAVEATALSFTSRVVSPLCVPILRAAPARVSVVRDDEMILDRRRRDVGYLWGGARVWRWSVTVTRAALTALRSGWIQGGQVRIDCGDTTAIASTVPSGALTGRWLGVESWAWEGPPGVEEYATLTVHIAGAPT